MMSCKPIYEKYIVEPKGLPPGVAGSTAKACGYAYAVPGPPPSPPPPKGTAQEPPGPPTAATMPSPGAMFSPMAMPAMLPTMGMTAPPMMQPPPAPVAAEPDEEEEEYPGQRDGRPRPPEPKQRTTGHGNKNFTLLYTPNGWFGGTPNVLGNHHWVRGVRWSNLAGTKAKIVMHNTLAPSKNIKAKVE